jgi:hypothetical protein
MLAFEKAGVRKGVRQWIRFMNSVEALIFLHLQCVCIVLVSNKEKKKRKERKTQWNWIEYSIQNRCGNNCSMVDPGTFTEAYYFDSLQTEPM